MPNWSDDEGRCYFEVGGVPCHRSSKKCPMHNDDRADKVAYVKSQGQTRTHECHWPGCGKQVPPAMWGCKTCWYKLPKYLRDKIWLTYEPGQEVDMTPSSEYLNVADEVQEWIKQYGV